MPVSQPQITTTTPPTICGRFPPPFPWKYLGTFGPSRAPIAVFKRAGDVVNVRAGDGLGEYTLQRIGLTYVVFVDAGGKSVVVPAGD